LTRILAPALGGLLIGEIGAWAVGAAGALIMGGVVLHAWRCLIANATQCWDDQREEEAVVPEAA
jgi:hypothetical protein